MSDPWLVIPIPLRSDCVVRVQIPRDLTLEEAAKIGRVITAMASERALLLTGTDAEYADSAVEEARAAIAKAKGTADAHTP